MRRECFVPLPLVPLGIGVLAMTLGISSGCAFKWKSVRERQMETELGELKGRLAQVENSRQDLLKSREKLEEDIRSLQDERAREIQRLTEEKERATARVAEEKTRQGRELVEAQRRLAESLSRELSEAKAKLQMTERGLVLTFLEEIFFDSGKAEVKPEGFPVLEKVAAVLKETVPEAPVAVEGHTDNEPIRYSGWKSNWELSTGRALGVVHHFINVHGVQPQRLRAVGFGEFQPVASNETPEGRRQNRRVEVVILPTVLKKTRSSSP